MDKPPIGLLIGLAVGFAIGAVIGITVLTTLYINKTAKEMEKEGLNPDLE